MDVISQPMMILYFRMQKKFLEGIWIMMPPFSDGNSFKKSTLEGSVDFTQKVRYAYGYDPEIVDYNPEEGRYQDELL